MRAVAAAFVLLGAGVLPIVAGPRLRASASPAALLSVGVASLVAMAAGTVAVLAALIDPGALPATALPQLVDRCMGAASDILAHPVQHWPKILAALLIVLVLGRLVYSVIVTMYRMHELSVDTSRIGERGDDVVEVTTRAPLAMTVGVLRRRIIISSSLARLLTPLEREAVIAHERAHVAGHHPVILLLAQSLVLAFGRIPPVREAARCIVVGLEVAADDAAVVAVGDPFVVASALERMAGPPASGALAVADTEVAVRARRLCGEAHHHRPDHSLRLVGGAIVAAALVVTLALSSRPAGATGAVPRGAVEHEVCHLPH